MIVSHFVYCTGHINLIITLWFSRKIASVCSLIAVNCCGVVVTNVSGFIVCASLRGSLFHLVSTLLAEPVVLYRLSNIVQSSLPHCGSQEYVSYLSWWLVLLRSRHEGIIQNGTFTHGPEPEVWSCIVSSGCLDGRMKGEDSSQLNSTSTLGFYCESPADHVKLPDLLIVCEWCLKINSSWKAMP